MSVSGDVLAQLGIELDLEDTDDLITDAMVICKVSKADGATALAVRVSEGTDWITLRGMIASVNDDAAMWEAT